MRFLRFTPIYQTRVWGGRALETCLGRKLPDALPYGESWEIVDRAEANSVIDGGPHRGQTLREALQTDAAALMGPQWNPQEPFPILVKWLDARERLSLQVHPPAALASQLGGEPKTENWYVAHAEPGAALVAGLKRGVTPEAFARHLADNTLEAAIHRIGVGAGESLFVRSGRLHAIDAGNLILEIQQNSDTTYRVYDWGRLGLDGKPRQLHIEASLRCIDFNDFEPQTIKPQAGTQQLVSSEIFDLHKHDLAAGEALTFAAGEQPRLLSLVRGSLRETGNSGNEDGHLRAGDNILLPYAEAFSFVAQMPATVLITENFALNP